MSVRAAVSLAVLVVIMAVHLAATVCADEPLTLDEIASLREQKQTPGQIIRAAKERGRGFPLDETARERLKELGFNATAIATLAKARETDPPAAPAPAAGDHGDAATDDTQADVVDRIVKEAATKAGVPLTASEGDRSRVFSGPGVPPQFAADARQVESRLAAAFPRSFVSRIDKRAVNVMIVATRSEYGNLLDAVAKAGENNGVRYANEDGRSIKEIGAGKPALYLRGLTTMCLEGAVPDHVRRAVAHAVGYHALEHASRGRAGDALAGGFGNVTEVLLFGTPGTTVAGGYAERDVGGAGAWPDLVRQRFAEQRIRGLGATLDRTFSTMEMPDYAEAWSLTALLSMAPDKFAAAVAAMRGGTDPLPAILDAYGVDEVAIVKEWQQRSMAR